MAIIVGSGSAGCASASTVAARAPHVAFADLPKHPEHITRIAKQPVVLVFEAGEHIPVWFDLDSSVLATATKPEKLELIASRRFYLLVDPNRHGFRLSTDGKDFDRAPKNSFRFGFAVSAEEVHVALGLGLRPEQK